MVASAGPGTEIRLEVLREGKPLTLRVTLGTRLGNLALKGGAGKAPSTGTLRGITVQELTPALRGQLDLPEGTRGVVISGLDPDSPAAQEGLQEGDVIQAINHQPVTGVSDFNRLAAKATGDVLLRINRQGTGLFVVLSPIEEGGGP